MQQLSRVIIADTSCFILLDKIEYLSILKDLFYSVTTTPEVKQEFGKPLPHWVLIESVINKNAQLKLESDLDYGEASAIALALERDNALLILDDLKARKIASKLKLQFTGTLGIFLKAKETGIIQSLKPILEKIQLTDFRFSDKVFNEILSIANEAK